MDKFSSHRPGRAYKRSRQGCSNCKLRKVKCDESKPVCKRCATYGVFCNYNAICAEDLQLSTERVSDLLSLPYWPSKNEELLDKFQVRTALTVSTGRRLCIYQNEIVALARSSRNSCLMHAIFTLSLMHDRYFTTNPKLTISEAYHWHQATSAFLKQLSDPFHANGKEVALCTTAALLGTIVFCHIDASTPAEAWPLKPPSSTDLDWLKLSAGKSLWTPTQPSVTAENPLLSELAMGEPPKEALTPPTQLLESRPVPEHISVFQFLGASSIESPYYSAALALEQIMHSENFDAIEVILRFWSFVHNMPPLFRMLLEQKDPRALFFLSCWYSNICNIGVWWLSKRATLEGLAICLYLEQHFTSEIRAQKLIQSLKSKFLLALEKVTPRSYSF